MNSPEKAERLAGTLLQPFRGTFHGTGTAETRAVIGLAAERHPERCPSLHMERSTSPLGMERWNGGASIRCCLLKKEATQ